MCLAAAPCFGCLAVRLGRRSPVHRPPLPQLLLTDYFGHYIFKVRGTILVFAALFARAASATRHIGIGFWTFFFLRRRPRPRGERGAANVPCQR